MTNKIIMQPSKLKYVIIGFNCLDFHNEDVALSEQSHFKKAKEIKTYSIKHLFIKILAHLF